MRKGLTDKMDAIRCYYQTDLCPMKTGCPGNYFSIIPISRSQESTLNGHSLTV